VLTAEQARAVLQAARKDRLYAYALLGLTTGVRTEETRWDHVDLDGQQLHMDVWRSVRAGGPA